MDFDEACEEIAGALSRHVKMPQDAALASLAKPEHGFGDISSTFAFTLAKERKVNPVEAAKSAAETFKCPLVESVSATGPYVNFKLSAKFYSAALAAMSKPPKVKKAGKKRRVILEFPSVNPNKPWHVGHLRNALLGDSVGKMLTASGDEVVRLDYIDDLGLQVAESAYGLREYGIDESLKYDHAVGLMYVKVTEMMKMSPQIENEVRAMLKNMEEGGNEDAELARQLSEKVVAAQYETNAALRITHDALVFESDILREIFPAGLEMLKASGAIHLQNEGKNAGCYVADLGFSFKDMKDDQKVIIRSDGTATYIAKDIIFQLWKSGISKGKIGFSKFIAQWDGGDLYMSSKGGSPKKFSGGDASISVIGSEQAYPQLVIKELLKKTGHEKQSDGMFHLAYEHASLPEGKFSGRAGTWVGYTVDEFISEAISRANAKIGKEFGLDEKAEISRAVGVGAIKYSFLKTSPEKKIIFDWERSLSLEGDSGPYIMYARVRAAAILAKAGKVAPGVPDCGTLDTHERALILQLSMFARVLGRAAKDLRPHYVCEYASDVATLFNRFYAESPVLNAEDKKIRARRIMLVAAASNVLGMCLDLLGIEPVEKM
jgi:arginyl-tRNA synthetase